MDRLQGDLVRLHACSGWKKKTANQLVRAPRGSEHRATDDAVPVLWKTLTTMPSARHVQVSRRGSWFVRSLTVEVQGPIPGLSEGSTLEIRIRAERCGHQDRTRR